MTAENVDATTGCERKDRGDAEADVGASTACDVLRHERRRALLEELIAAPTDRLQLDEVVEALAEGNAPPGDRSEPTRHERERVAAGLIHRHLPRLEAAGLIEFEDAKEVISYRRSSRVETLLETVRDW